MYISRDVPPYTNSIGILVPLLESLLRTVGIRGSIPTYGVSEDGNFRIFFGGLKGANLGVRPRSLIAFRGLIWVFPKIGVPPSMPQPE